MELSKTYEEEKEYTPNSLDLLMVEIFKGLIIPEQPFFEPVENENNDPLRIISTRKIREHSPKLRQPFYDE